MASKSKGIPGNSMQEARELGEILVREANVLHQVARTFDTWGDNNQWFAGLTIRPPDEGRAGYLVIGRTDGEQGRLVSFHDAPTFSEAIVGWCERARNGTLRWKEDQYAK